MTSALAQHFNLPQSYADLTIAEVTGQRMWQLEGVTGIGAQITELTGMPVPETGHFAQDGDQLLVWQGRDRYFWLTPNASLPEVNDVYITDQTASKTQIRISGDQARTLLARGLPVDLDNGMLAIGEVRMTHINHISVVLLRLPDKEGKPIFELWAMRGFAVSLMSFLTTVAASLA
jgi:sarcosine oxidase subunit gamma